MKEVEIIKYELGGIRNPGLKIIGVYKKNLNIMLLGDNEKIEYNVNCIIMRTPILTERKVLSYETGN